MAKKYQKVTQPWELLLESNDFRHDLSILFNDAFLRSVAQIAGRSDHTKELSAGVELGVRAYLRAQQEMKWRKPGKMETRLIEPIADAAYKLQKTIERVEKTKNPQFKLAASLEATVGIGTGRGADLLAVGTEQFGSGEQLRTLREITSLLASASAKAVGKSAGDSSEDKHARGRAILDAEVKAWKERPQRTPTYPVECFIKAFRPTWQKCSVHPYTEGMYLKNTKRTRSPAVDSVHLIGLQLDSKMPRSRVVTAFRNQLPV